MFPRFESSGRTERIRDQVGSPELGQTHEGPEALRTREQVSKCGGVRIQLGELGQKREGAEDAWETRFPRVGAAA